MKFKSEKGFTGIDITVAIIIITIFVSIISVIFYNITLSSRKIERQTEATYIATDIIEQIKAYNYEDVVTTDDLHTTEIESINLTRNENNESNFMKLKTSDFKDGYNVTLKIQNYIPSENIDSQENIIISDTNDLVKIITVTVQYKVGKDTETVELKTRIVRYI